MPDIQLTIPYTHCTFEELSSEDRILVGKAQDACKTAYAPYSHFCVGAAIALNNGEIICGSNQENAAYPSGTCAERCAMFYANAQHPQATPITIAIAACNTAGDFSSFPITPCGACRQVLLESEIRYKQPLRIILYGVKSIYILKSVRSLLPFQFDSSAL